MKEPTRFVVRIPSNNVVGALVGLGIPEYEAKAYEEAETDKKLTSLATSSINVAADK
jgi:hypothetical protein